MWLLIIRARRWSELRAMPSQHRRRRGGRLGMRTLVAADGAELLISEADNGKGIKQSLPSRLSRASKQWQDHQTGVGLAPMKAVS